MNLPYHEIGADHRLGERTYALRGIYEQLQEKLPANAVVQHNPNQPIGDVFHGLYEDRQTAVETPVCGVVFGGDTRRCDAVMPQIANIQRLCGARLARRERCVPRLVDHGVNRQGHGSHLV